MPIQSKRISLTALGIENVPGMENGNHLRVGFDPRMGFPPCGFLLYRRAHETGETVALDWARLFDQQIPAPMRHGYLQDGIAVFHPNAPPPEGGENGLEVRDQIVCISFRTSPFVPDSTPKVCQVHLEISWDEGAVTVQAFDDRYDTGGFRKILVAHQEHSEPTEKAIDLRADLISLVEIKAPEGARLITFEYTIISELGWEPMDLPAESPWGNTGIPLLLPTPKFVNATSSSYPTCPELNFPQEASAIESDLPVSRLHTGFVARQSEEDFHGEYDDESRFFDVYLGPGRERITELIELLRALQEVPLAQQLQFTITNEGENNEEVTTIAPLSLILSGAVDYAFARLIGLAALDLDPPPNDAPSADYMVEARWDDEVGHFWITHDVFQGRDGLLNPPQPPEVTLVRDATRPEHVKTNVQLDWQAPDVIARLDRANQYAGYLVFRRQGEEVKDWVRLTQSHDELTDLFTPDLLLLGEIQGDAPAPPSSASAGHYLDRPPDYSQFQYGLQAQDLFGRRSEITWTEDIEVFELLEPPPVSDLFAFYLDTNDPVQSQAQLDANAAQILSVTGQSGFSGTALLISFRYPKASIQAVSSLLSFNISYRHGRPNEFLGTLAAPVIVGPPPALSTAPVLADIEFTTATPVPNGIDGFGGKRSRGALTSRGEFFAVQSATRLGTNLVRLRVKARRDYLPQKGEASLTIGRGGAGVTPHPLFVSPRDAFRWTGFDLRHPQGTGDQRPIRLSAANNTVLAPLPVAVTATQLVVSRTVEKPANLEPNEPSVASDWVYRVVVKNIELPLPTGLTEYFGSVTVQAISGSQRQSELPAPAYVQRRLYGAPPPLTELGTSEFVTAGRPDFEGRIGVVLTWPKIAGVQKFNVYRAEVPKLLDARGANPELAKDLFDNATNRAQVKLLGGQRASISSFTLATPVAITPETDPDAPTRHRWIDRVAAPREQSYVYRIQPLSVTGDEAPWPLDSAVPNENRNRCILVLQKNRDLLLPPAIYELEPLDRSIGVVVRDPRSESVTGLRIYKTDQPSLVHDVRSMTLIHGTIPFTHQRIQTLPATNGTPARLKFVDGKVQVGIQYFYRVMFVDEFGNQSQPSEPMAATPRSFAPPEPPALTAQRTATGTVNLSWQANHNEGQVKPQRKRSGEGEWIDLTPGWLTPTGTAVDTAATGIVAHRLLLRDARGRVVFSEVVITEA